MSFRFHNKFHNNSHHTDSTIGESDSALDPIGSENDPFNGDFHLDGLLASNGDLTVLGNVDLKGTMSSIDGTRTQVGIVRIATSTEAEAMTRTDVVLNPVDLHRIVDEFIEEKSKPHKLLGNTHISTVVTGSKVENKDIVKFKNEKWTNIPFDFSTDFATYNESREGKITNKAVNARDVLDIIDKNKPRATEHMKAQQNKYTVGTLGFQKHRYRTSYGNGNSISHPVINTHKIFRWNGYTWVAVSRKYYSSAWVGWN